MFVYYIIYDGMMQKCRQIVYEDKFGCQVHMHALATPLTALPSVLYALLLSTVVS